MVKVLHLGQMVGGLDIYVRNSIVYMSDEFDFIVVRSDKDQTEAVLKNNHKVKDYTIKMYRQLNPLNDCIALIQAIRIIMKERPDVIHRQMGRFLNGCENPLHTPCILFPMYRNRKKKTCLYMVGTNGQA